MSAAAPVLSPEPQTGLEPLGSLAARLRAADRILQKERGLGLLLRSWPWLTGAIVLALVLDVVLHLSGAARLGIDLALAVAALAGLSWCAWLVFGRRNTFEHVARVLEARHPRLGSKLINILQLRAQTQDPALAPLTRELAGMAIGGYAEDLRHEPVEELAHTNQVAADAKRAFVGVLGLAVLLAALFEITRTEIPRFLDPFGDHPPYSFTRLEITSPQNDGTSVVYNESLLVTAKSAGHRPSELYLSWFPAGHPEQTSTLPMFDRGERGFTQQIESITGDLVAYVHTKNRHAVSRQRKVSVMLTPRLEKAWVKITPPAYTELPAVEKPFEFKTIKALEGSAIEFRLASNRPLASGQLTVTSDSGEERIAMAPAGEKQVSGHLEAKNPATLKFSLADRDGFASPETWEAVLTVTHDLPPDVQVTNPPNDSFVAMDFKAEPAIEATDDYGLKTLRIHIARNGTFDEPRVVHFDQVTLHAREVVPLDFQSMHLQSGDTVSLFAEAIDNAPNPHLARSKTVTFTVISTEEYNNFLREREDIADIEAKYAKLVNEMRDLADQQKQLGDAIAALQPQLDAAKSDAEKQAVQKKLDDLVAQQKALNEKLDQLADTMENFVRDQPLYDVEAELKNTLAEKAQEIRDSIQANAEDLQKLAEQQASAPNGETPNGQPKAGGQQAPSQKMLEQFKKASDEQLARLGATQEETEQQVVQPLKDLGLLQAIMNDINRFKELYAAQEELAKQAQAYNRAGSLNREDQLGLKNLGAQQKAIGDALDELEQRFWEDGKAAEEKFPKAAKSAKVIAQKMGDLKLQTLANQATREMVGGNGPTGAQLAENLRHEMEKIFSSCKSKNGDMSDELDQYLSIQRGLNSGGSFGQMMQSHKLGQGFKPGSGQMGQGGRDGYAIMSGQDPHVLGNEPLPGNSGDQKPNDGNGKNKTPAAEAKPQVSLDQNDVVKGVNPLNRESEAVQGETIIQQYTDLVEEYFKALTKDPKKDAKPKGKP
jgi:hypothetical protein